MNQLHFIPKVALVTGAGSGRDLVTADAFAKAGAAVTFPDVRGGKNMRSTTIPRKRGAGGLRAGRVLTTLVAVVCSILWAAAASAADAAEQAVLDAHEKRRDATLAGDAAAVGSMMTDDLTFTHANAVVE